MHDLHRYHFSRYLKGGIAIFEPFPIRERRRRELRIFMSFNSRTRNWKVTEGDPSFCNENYIKNSGQFRNQAKQDLTCINRYWFDTNNGSCFSMLRIQMYPQFI
ncbi:hypothetical protein DAI22_02g011801 [Oryza sativa Japonica Group]|nr:hypothetical protein DAI22_02g011801 [Oryza sativa Japonica Group]